jgi:hypothetical protein
MKIVFALKSALVRLPGIWKGAMTLWFIMLLLVALLAIPMKGALNAGFGKSMITEKLRDGINVEVFSDLGATLTSLVSYFSAGFFLVLLSGFLINTFFAGGFFNSMKRISGKFTTVEFFSASVKNFWSFLVISVIIYSIILFLIVFIIVIPVTIVSQADAASEGALLKTCIVVFSIFFLLLMVLILVADYARAWQVTKEKNLCFRAIGFGFSQTFRSFAYSYPMIIIILIVQLLFGWLAFKIISGLTPAAGGGIFLLFLLSQFLFFIKIMLKVWRYGSVMALMHENERYIFESMTNDN